VIVKPDPNYIPPPPPLSVLESLGKPTLSDPFKTSDIESKGNAPTLEE
jgi:hypothetical protein